MDFSKLKIELYDFFGILIPGTILVSECMLAVSGWQHFIPLISMLPGNVVAAYLAVSYVAGHFVQEAGDVLVGIVSPPRYLKKSRDQFWESADGRQVRETIKCEVGFEIESVDVAYDYCLSKSKQEFTKRDAFIATSDLARSMLFLTIPTLIAITIAGLKEGLRGWSLSWFLLTLLAGLATVFYVAWRRMVRFRRFSDLPVFAAYLAATSKALGTPSSALGDTQSAEVIKLQL